MSAPPGARCSATSRRSRPSVRFRDCRRPSGCGMRRGRETDRPWRSSASPTDPPTRPLIRTPNLILRAPQANGLCRLGRAAHGEPRVPDALGAGLERGRPDAHLVPPARQARRPRDREPTKPIRCSSSTRRSDTLLGGLTLGLVRRGVAQACTLGYWMGQRHAGKGHMTEAVRGALRFAFSDLALHRVEAACLPEQRAVPPPAGARRLPA